MVLHVQVAFFRGSLAAVVGILLPEIAAGMRQSQDQGYAANAPDLQKMLDLAAHTHATGFVLIGGFVAVAALLAYITWSYQSRSKSMAAQKTSKNVKHVCALPSKAPADLPPMLLHELLEESFQKHAELTALRCGASLFTYGELSERTGAVASWLRAEGVGHGDVVLLLMSRQAELVVGVIGILKAGACFLPLDADWPGQRISGMAEEAACKHALSQSELVPRLQGFNGKIHILDSVKALPSNSQVLAEVCKPHDLAMIMFTSGSTGKPKGTMIPHSCMTAYLRAPELVAFLRSGWRVAFRTNVVFDAVGVELWLPLSVGATLHVMSGFTEPVPESISYAFSCPSAVSMVPLPNGLQTLISGGEALTESVLKAMPDTCTCFNCYGPTETTVHSHVKVLSKRDPVTPSIGHSLSTVSCFIVSEAGQLQPVGVKGEILIGGPQVTSGYLKRPALTAEKFVERAWQENGAPQRFYRTGDLGKWLPSGEVMLLGRMDHQVKVRGRRIELGEIEAALCSAGAAEAVVKLDERGASAGSARLVAFARFARPTGPEAGPTGEALAMSLMEKLAQALPKYMLPDNTVIVEEWPRTSSGKIDRNAIALPAVDLTQDGPHETPSSQVEETICTAMGQVLKMPVERISVLADFFKLGGSSVSASALERELRALGLAASVADIFRYRTARALAPRCRAGSAMAVLGTDQESRPGLPWFFSFGQAIGMAVTFTASRVPDLLAGIALLGAALTDFRLAIIVGCLMEALEDVLTIIVVWVLKKVLVGRLPSGQFPVGGYVHFKWWISNILEKMIEGVLSRWVDSVVLVWLLRLFGASVEYGAFVGSQNLRDLDQLTLTRTAILETNAMVHASEYTPSCLKIFPVRISGWMRESSFAGHGSEIAGIVPPATCTQVPADLPQTEYEPLSKVLVAKALVCCTFGCVYLPVIGLIYVAIAYFNDRYLSVAMLVLHLIMFGIAAYIVTIISALCMLVALKRLAGRAVPGPSVSSASSLAVDFFYSSDVVQAGILYLFCFYEVNFLYRAMGATIEDNVWLEHLEAVDHISKLDLLTLCHGAATGGMVTVIFSDRRRTGECVDQPICLSEGVLTGNDAVLMPGTVLPEGTWLGAFSIGTDAFAPYSVLGEAIALEDGRAEPMFMYSRGKAPIQKFWTPGYGRALLLVVACLLVVVPCGFVELMGIFYLSNLFYRHLGVQALALLPVLALMDLAYWSAVVAGVKQLTGEWLGYPMTQPRPGAHAVLDVLDHIFMKGRRIHFLGTLMQNVYLRALGAKIDPGVIILTEWLCMEAEQLSIGKGAVVNAGVDLLTHNIENQVCTYEPIEIGKGACIGPHAYIAGLTKIADFVHIAEFARLTKGQHATEHVLCKRRLH